MVENLFAMETQVPSLGWRNALEKGLAIHFKYSSVDMSIPNSLTVGMSLILFFFKLNYLAAQGFSCSIGDLVF